MKLQHLKANLHNILLFKKKTIYYINRLSKRFLERKKRRETFLTIIISHVTLL